MAQTQMKGMPPEIGTARLRFMGASKIPWPLEEGRQNRMGDEVRFVVVGRVTQEGEKETTSQGQEHAAGVKVLYLEEIQSGSGRIKLSEELERNIALELEPEPESKGEWADEWVDDDE